MVQEMGPVKMRVGVTVIPICILGDLYYLELSSHTLGNYYIIP